MRGRLGSMCVEECVDRSSVVAFCLFCLFLAQRLAFLHAALWIPLSWRPWGRKQLCCVLRFLPQIQLNLRDIVQVKDMVWFSSCTFSLVPSVLYSVFLYYRREEGTYWLGLAGFTYREE